MKHYKWNHVLTIYLVEVEIIIQMNSETVLIIKGFLDPLKHLGAFFWQEATIGNQKIRKVLLGYLSGSVGIVPPEF